MSAYTLTHLGDVENVAAKFGLDSMDVRFAREDLESEQIGISHHKIKPGETQPFAHRHKQAEEIYVVISGAGSVRLDGEDVELRALDAVRVDPPVTRLFTAGGDGLEFLAFGPHHQGDGEQVPPEEAG